MEKTAWTGQTPMKRPKKTFPFGFLVLGLFLLSLVTVSMPGCKGAPPEERPADKPKVSTRQYMRSLFKDDPESWKEFERIQAEFRTGKHSLAIGELRQLMKRSPQAPWVEAVEFYLAQAWMLLRKHGPALRQIDLFLDRYPTSPLVLRASISKGQIYLAKGKQHAATDADSQASEEYLRKAEEIFRQMQKNAPKNPAVRAEVGYHLGEVYAALQDTNRAREAFRKVADAYPDTPYASKALYGLAGVLLGEADLEGAGRAFSEIEERHPKTRLAGKATNRLEGIRLAGSQAPPLQIKKWIGEPPPVGEGFEGKVTLLSFWAIWCPHCRRNIPNMERLLETYAKRGVSVVGITKEKEGYGIEKVKEYIDSHPMSYPTGVDDEGKMSEEMAVNSIPCVVVVDPQGRISWHGHPDYLTDRVLEALLKRSS